MKFLNKQIRNMLYTYKRSKNRTGYNVLYKPYGTFFDLAMSNMDPNILTTIPIKDQDNDFIQKIFYSLLWINDPIDFSHNIPHYAEFFTKIIVAIHSPPSPLFKKEDLNIIKNRLSPYDIICFHKNFEQWPIDNILYIDYGIPYQNKQIIKEKTNDILIINTKKNKQSYILYQYLKSEYPGTDMLEIMPENMQNLYKFLSKYKVCIELEDYYNLIIANSCGCYGMTPVKSYDENIITIQNYEDISRILPDLLSSNDSNKISQSVLSKYDWNKFSQNIYEYMNGLIFKDLSI